MRHPHRAAVMLGATLVFAGCRGSDELSPAERLTRGREVVQRMSDTLAKAGALSVKTRETRAEPRPDGTARSTTVTRDTILRRPDRLHFTTSGDRRTEGWYDGVGFTLAMHGEKAFAQARMPETLDRTLDAIAERYAITMPLADFLYSSPAKALLTETATGGWVGAEQVDGVDTDHVSFKDTGVVWDLWVARNDHLPRRGRAVFSGRKRLGTADVSFSEWNLAPAITTAQFRPHVPPDYEGIAILQRASVLEHTADERPEATSGKQ